MAYHIAWMWARCAFSWSQAHRSAWMRRNIRIEINTACFSTETRRSRNTKVVLSARWAPPTFACDSVLGVQICLNAMRLLFISLVGNIFPFAQTTKVKYPPAVITGPHISWSLNHIETNHAVISTWQQFAGNTFRQLCNRRVFFSFVGYCRWSTFRITGCGENRGTSASWVQSWLSSCCRCWGLLVLRCMSYMNC